MARCGSIAISAENAMASSHSTFTSRDGFHVAAVEFRSAPPESPARSGGMWYDVLWFYVVERPQVTKPSPQVRPRLC